MHRAYRISAFALLVFFASLSSANRTTNQTAIDHISQAELVEILPADADRKNIKRQQKAFQRGLYWTKHKTLKPLDLNG